MSDFPVEEALSLVLNHRNEEKEKGKTSSIKMFGEVKCRAQAHVHVVTGPVVGKVTQNSAIILVEVDSTTDVTCYLVASEKAGDGDDSASSGSDNQEETQSQTKKFYRFVPGTFVFKDLVPNTTYSICFGNISPVSIRSRTGRFTTEPESRESINIVLFSCDRPERHVDGDTLVWKHLAERVKKNEIDLMLHLGDQVYAQKESTDASALTRHNSFSSEDPEERKKQLTAVFEAATNKMSDIYRFTWNLEYTAYCLANCPHAMIWSDNDIYNDFSIAEGVPPVLIAIGQQCYRNYQRALWDDDIHDDQSHTNEFYTLKYGSVGVMMFDMRGNRIDVNGNQFPENPLVNEEQWACFQELLDDEDIKVLLVCAEIPFVSDPPDVVKAGAEKVPFLKDHWGYNDKELFTLLEKVFEWKAVGGREVVMIGGDIHVGCETEVRDATTGLSIKQIVASPITNHVCGYFPALENSLNDRFSYTHTPLDGQKNYANIKITFGDGVPTVEAALIGTKSFA